MIKVALVGAGHRGMFAYGSYALKRPDEIQFVAVAEPNEERRKKFSDLHHISEDMQFSSWDELLAQPKLCEAILICTQDRDHFQPTMKALEVGYHLLLEKPMSPDPREAITMAEEAERQERILKICHTSRHSTFFGMVKKLLNEGKIGDIVSVQWAENVGYWHQAHSFVRGNWGNSKKSSPMLLQKCCHDMDMLQWLIGGKCERVSSFGSLTHFKESNAPVGSTERCTDGCRVEHQCPYSAIKLYLNEKDEFPSRVVSMEPSLEARMRALQHGPYGRCVYRCDNDVVDHQVVNLLFDNEVTVNFTMTAFTHDVSRSFKFMGTKGELRGHQLKNEIEIHNFSGEYEVVRPQEVEGGHHGADMLIMQDFIEQLKQGQIHNGFTSGLESVKSHFIVFAAEESRNTGNTVVMDDYIRTIRGKESVSTI